MLLPIIINFFMGCAIFILSCTGASLFYNFAGVVFSGFKDLLFLPLIIASIVFFYFCFTIFSICCCRIIQFSIPYRYKTGNFPNNSKIQFLRITTDVLTSHLCGPLYPSMPFLVSFMGASTGKNLSFSGKIFNADLLEAGDNVVIGEDAFICAHLQQSQEYTLEKIKIGNDVTIGVRSLIMPGVTIGDRSIIAAYSLVGKNTQIRPGEIWGGIPAKKIGNVK